MRNFLYQYQEISTLVASETLFVTGATGKLGMHAVDSILKIDPDVSIIAGARERSAFQALEDLHAKGVQTRIAEYDDVSILVEAFSGVDRLLFISGKEGARRKRQHENVIKAAMIAGIGFIAYTSILRASTSPLLLADDHRHTELMLSESGIPHVLLRNGWYAEILNWRIAAAIKANRMFGIAGEGRISAASRADYAEAAARILVYGMAGKQIYELAGDESFSLRELAEFVSFSTNKPIVYEEVHDEIYRTNLLRAGAPLALVNILLDIDRGISEGALFENRSELASIIGRKTTSYKDVVREFLGNRHALA
ncbi:NAD(P)H dehydrogenase (quinone) [Xanthomonas arboricola]|uniref:NAD(P)H-binding protein n=1 Tax=Xanthomonas cannabis TaxID=1885674 RepID=UPI0016094E1D|nr:NAD(P)H-binding protein [Xanthomonas cannabis]MBB3802269.1 NAD(P)H dehydrogenase (quinone) [Xanthomonas cannabis]